MKAFAALLLLASVVTAKYVPGAEDEITKYQRECASELNLSNERSALFNDLRLSPNKCFLKCVNVKQGIFDEERGLNVENVFKQGLAEMGYQSDSNAASTLRAGINSCADNNEQGSDSCEWAYRTFMCIRNNF